MPAIISYNRLNFVIRHEGCHTIDILACIAIHTTCIALTEFCCYYEGY